MSIVIQEIKVVSSVVLFQLTPLNYQQFTIKTFHEKKKKIPKTKLTVLEDTNAEIVFSELYVLELCTID